MAKFAGIIAGAIQVGIGIVTANPALIISGGTMIAGSVAALIFAPPAPKTTTIERSIKSPTPPRVRGFGRRRLFGAYLFFDISSTGKVFDVLAFADRRARGLVQIYLNDDKVTRQSNNIVLPLADKRYQHDKIHIGYNLGLPTETAFAEVMASFPGVWTANHRGDGMVTGYLTKDPEQEKYFLETYPQGDNIEMSLVLDLQFVFDPRNGAHSPTDPTTWTQGAHNDNAALTLLTFLLLDRGYDYATQIAPRIDSWIAAANDCDDTATGEPRYRSCVVYSATDRPATTINSLLATFDGWMVEDVEGVTVCRSGSFYEPTVSIGPQHIVSYSHQDFLEEENFVNELTVTYVSDLHDYNTVECDAWIDQTDIDERGRVLNSPFDVQVPSYTQARRLAKRFMARNNAQRRGRVTTNYSGRIAFGERYINLLIEEAGLTLFDGVAEITGAERDFATGGLSFDWVEADPNIDAWNPETEDGLPAAVGQREPLEPVTEPTIDSAVPVYNDISVRVEITVSDGPPVGTTWFARWREEGSSAWNEQRYDDLDDGPNAVLLTDFVPAVESLEVQVEYRTAGGQISGWSTPSTLVDTRVDVDMDFDGGDSTTEVAP